MENINTLSEATIFQPKFDNNFHLKFNEAKTAVTEISDAVAKLNTAYNKFIQDMNEMNKYIYDSSWSGKEKDILATVNNTINLFNLTAQSISTHVQETNDSLVKTSQDAGEKVNENKTSIDSSLEDIQNANNGGNGGGTPGGGNNQPSDNPQNPSTPTGDGGFYYSSDADLEAAIKTAFAEGAYASEDAARKIADTIINRATEGQTNVKSIVSGGAYSAYGSNNWGWKNYEGYPGSDSSISAQRVKEIFMEELNRAMSGQGTTYNYKYFHAAGDGINNIYS